MQPLEEQSGEALTSLACPSRGGGEVRVRSQLGETYVLASSASCHPGGRSGRAAAPGPGGPRGPEGSVQQGQSGCQRRRWAR